MPRYPKLVFKTLLWHQSIFISNVQSAARAYVCCPSRPSHYQPLTTYNVLSTMQCAPCYIYHALSSLYHLSASIYHPSFAIYPSPSCLLNCQLYTIISHAVSDSIYSRRPSIKGDPSRPLWSYHFL